MPKTKTKPSLKNALAKRGPLKFDKTLLIVIAAVVVATGGYLFYKASHAGSTPPLSWQNTKLVYFTTTDGVKNNASGYSKVGDIFGYCSVVKVQTPYGVATRCSQAKVTRYSSSNVTISQRDITHNFSTGTYSPAGSWITWTQPNGGAGGGNGNWALFCSNTGNPTMVESVYKTVYGFIGYGMDFRPGPSNWQARFITGVTNANTTNYPVTSIVGCSASTGWMNVVGTW